MEQNTESNIIVGWGLAGVTLAWQMFFSNLKFSVVDRGENDATRTAAGLVNPVVFRRLTKSWNADMLMPVAEAFYSKIEEELGVKLLSREPIFRVFASVEEENNWLSKQGDERFEKYLTQPDKNELPNADIVSYPFGVGKVETMGNLDTNLYLDASKAFFEEKGVVFKTEVFGYENVKEGMNYFFCEGFGMKQNPFFKHLPLNGTHGETLTIKADELELNYTLNKNMFVMPLQTGSFKVGATYNWELKTPDITDAAKAELEEKLQNFTDFNYTVTEQSAGIRPTVTDRRPLLGTHNDRENMVLFNGLGTKGVMLAPYYAKHLLEHVYEGVPLQKEVSIKRFD